MSVYDGDLITPEASWDHFTESLGLASVGVLGVTVSECAQHALRASPHPERFREHVLIDFTGLTHTDVESKGKALRSTAEKRGWLYRPE